MKKIVLLAGVACLFASVANAEVKPYVGVDYNFSTLDWSNGYNSYIEDDYNSASLVAGAKLNRNFSLEAFYQMSQAEKRSDIDWADTSSRFTAYGLDALGHLPLGCYGKVEVIGGVGIGEYTFKTRNTYAGVTRDRSTGYRLNAGIQYNIDGDWSVRGMYHHTYNQNSYVDAMDEFSLGIRYNF